MRRGLTALLTCLFLGVSACSTGAPEGQVVSSTLDDPGAAQIGGADLGFTAETLDGDSFDGTTLAGKPAVLWFWAPWCPTCRALSGGVRELAQTYEGTVNVVGVGGLADAGDIRDYAETVDGPTHLVDADGEIWRHFGVTAQSTYLVIDGDGDVVAEGYLDDQDLATTVADLAG